MSWPSGAVILGRYFTRSRLKLEFRPVYSPRIVRGVVKGLFLARFQRNPELDRLSVLLREGIRLVGQIPGEPTKKVLHDHDLDRVLLVIAQLDFERFVEPVF